MLINNPPPGIDKHENAKRLREGLENHIHIIAEKVLSRFGRVETMDQLKQMLDFNEVVRFPSKIVFDSEALSESEPVRVERIGESTDEEYRIIVNPLFKDRDNDVIALVLYAIVKINYGKIAKEREGKLFASLILGRSEGEYDTIYNKLKDEIL